MSRNPASGLGRKLLLLSTLLLLTGCRSRQKEIIGTWTWDDEIVRFDANGEWGAFQKSDPAQRENMGGSWTTSRDSLTLQTTVIDPPEAPDLHFTLSPNGRQMVEDEDKTSVMIKR